MRIRHLALTGAALGLLAVGSAAPSPASDLKKFEGTITAPLPVVSNELAAMEDFCPDGGDAQGAVYRFFDLGADFKHFYISGPPTTLDEPLPADPSGVGVTPSGNKQDYDLDLYAFTAKCVAVDIEGPINTAFGNGAGTAAKPARYVAVNYYDGAQPNIPVIVEASNSPIKKK